jgi:hypothetical protein
VAPTTATFILLGFCLLLVIKKTALQFWKAAMFYAERSTQTGKSFPYGMAFMVRFVYFEIIMGAR